MFYRRKIILALLQAWDNRLPNTDFQKLLFLLSRKQVTPAFEFVPYKFGCFSWQSYADKGTMIGYGQLDKQEDWQKADSEDYLNQVSEDDRSNILALKQEVGNLSGKDLVRYVYLKHPYYAVKSEIADKIMSRVEMEIIERERPRDEATELFTIGYEGQSFDGFLNILVEKNIRVLCDVRKNPFSMKYGFSKNPLKDALAKLGIGYQHIPELGIASDKRRNLDSIQDYNALFEEYEKTTLKSQRPFLKKILGTLEQDKRIALMCFEKDPCMCHRGRLAHAVSCLPHFHYPLIHLRNAHEKKSTHHGQDVPDLFGQV